MRRTGTFELMDGRRLAWADYGAEGGTPVIALHGSPGTCLDFAFLGDVATQRGVRLVAPDRPGYGYSSFDAARTYETFARDVGQLADHLGFERFGVVGHSSGGPNAAGCARFLADRLVGCAIVSGVAPPDARVPKRGMLRSNRVAQRLAWLAPRVTSVAFQAGLRQGQRRPDKMFDWMMRTLPASDAKVIERPDVRAALREEMTDRLSSTAGRSAVQDLTLERRPWAFALGDISGPVQVWHGDADRNVLPASGSYLARSIPNATLHMVPDQAHWLYCSHFADILDSLLT